MKITTSTLLAHLQEKVNHCQQQATEYKKLPPESLQWRPNSNSWSVLECLEHLNRFGKIYLREFNTKIRQAPHQPEPQFKSGWLGNYAAQSMLPSAGGRSLKIPTQKDKNPRHAPLGPEVIDEFIRQQEELQTLLVQAAQVNLNKVRCQLTLPLLTFKLGDTLRFIINHQLRHIAQADRVLQARHERAA